MSKFQKMYVGVVKNPSCAHLVQEWLNIQGFFSIKVTPMGANRVLLEEIEEGIIPALMSDASDYVSEFFNDIRG